MEALQSTNRTKWDKNVEKMTSITKLGKVHLIHQQIKPHPLLTQKRDMFYKQIGFAYRNNELKLKEY